jgi:hypothetical protein
VKDKQRISIVLCALLATMLHVRTVPLLAQEKTSEDMTKSAWDAFNKSDYMAAIKGAEECIYEFEGTAKRQQSELAKNKEAMPPTGRVSPGDRSQILERGVLNDVATCLWIKGRSAEYLYRKSKGRDSAYRDQAVATYQATCGLTYARTWDTKGFFWSPAEAASDGLARLHSECP